MRGDNSNHQASSEISDPLLFAKSAGGLSNYCLCSESLTRLVDADAEVRFFHALIQGLGERAL